MRLLKIQNPPHLDSLVLSEQDKPAPRENEVLVRLTSAGLNRGDTLFCQNRYFHKPLPGSRVGFEGAGIIEAIGASVNTDKRHAQTFNVGDRVAICPMSFDVNTQGCLADYGCYDPSTLIPTPTSISDQDAGAIWMAYLTAWGGIVDAGALQSGETLVITAASSSVGIAAIQLGKQLGAVTIATTSSQDKADTLKEIGADHVIVQDRSDEQNLHYVDEIDRITNKQGTDLVFDAVAGPGTHGLVKASKRGGRIIIQGMLDRRPMDIHAGVLMKRLLTVKGYTLDLTLDNAEKKARAITDISQGFESGQLTPTISGYHALTDFKAAFEEILANKHIGKIVVNP